VFDRHGTDRIAAWKEFRDNLETSDHPLEEVAELWSHAPFVSSYLDPKNPANWPDPWHLILDLRLDDLAIALGMLYTIKLTQRFMNAKCEIHMSMLPNNNEPSYMLIVDDTHVLNLEYKDVVSIDKIKKMNTSLIWCPSKL
jgi:hypothetical protein